MIYFRIRDIHIKLSVLSLEPRKELSLELKWDANRDPSMRLGLLAEYNNPSDKKFDGNIMITYPDRTISCGFDAFTGGPTYYGNARAAWSINEVITFSYNAGLIPGKIINNWIEVELNTPFEGWHRNFLKAGAYNAGNLILINSTMLWADDQNLDLLYKSDYYLEDPIISFDVRVAVNSSVKDIPTLSIKAKHWQDLKKFDSDCHLHYSGVNDTLNIYSIKSLWVLSQNKKFQNISGTLVMISPFEGYNKGGLTAKFSLSNQKQLTGAASLTFDIREFTMALDGYVKRFTDNMLTVNITTPLEKFRTIKGRFGLSEQKRHAVAEVRAPSMALGVEALWAIDSLINFDVKLSVATPIEGFRQAAVFAKLKPVTVDFRGIWNNATIGFTGVWRMDNITDFEYSYKVYTPLVGFEENGFIIRLIKKDVFILDLHGKLSHYKLGVSINGQPKSHLLKALGSNKIEMEILYDDDFQPPQVENDEDYEELSYDEFFSYFLSFDLDTVAWPTITGVLDIQEISDFYLIVGNVELPQGRVDLKNRLYYPDYVNVINVLDLKTPFSACPEIKTILEYHVDYINYHYFYDKIKVIINNRIDPPKVSGIELNYTKIVDALKPRQHNVMLNLVTPLDVLPELVIIGHLELEENIYKGNISSKTPLTYLSLAASVEVIECIKFVIFKFLFSIQNRRKRISWRLLWEYYYILMLYHIIHVEPISKRTFLRLIMPLIFNLKLLIEALIIR